MAEHPPHFSPDTPRPREQMRHPRYDLSTIMGIKVDEVKLPKEIVEMADEYLAQLVSAGANNAQMAEMAYAFRRQLQEDLRRVKADKDTAEEDLEPLEGGEAQTSSGLTKRLRTKLLKTDGSHAFSLAIYRRLLEKISGTIQTELARHQKEMDEINGSYEVYKDLEQQLSEKRQALIGLLADMFKRAGQEPKPIHLAKRAMLEAGVADLEAKLQTVKERNPDVAALVEYDTIREYADQLRGNGFIWTKSRQKLLQDVLTGVLTSRPVVMLYGETGSGKTGLARAVSIELASSEPERTVGGPSEKFERLFGNPSIKAGDTSYDFGPLLRAMTGRTSSADKEGKGGGIFFDDEFNTRPTAVQRQILKFVSEARPGRKVAVPGTSLVVTVEPGFLYLAAGNPPSERYDREETGIETKREFAGNVINVEYLGQSAENPELYQVMEAALLDQSTGRLTAVSPEELQPAWRKDAVTGEFHLDTDPTSGAFLWRFANAWGEMLKAFSGKDTVLHKKNPGDPKAKHFLPSFILDTGIVLSWLDQYKASPKDRARNISVYLTDKFTVYLSQFPEKEQKTVRCYLDHFALGKKHDAPKPPARVLTPKEIGYLNPNVPRPKEKSEGREFPTVDFIDPETGDVSGQYKEGDTLEWHYKSTLDRVSGADMTLPEQVTIIGKIVDEETMVVEVNGVLQKLDIASLRSFYQESSPPPPPEAGELAPFAYDTVKAREYGFAEMKLEAHPKAQELIDAVFARDSRYVTLHKAGDPDPDSTSTPQATLTADKYKLKKDALTAYWQQHCPDLPNTPEKSLWYFEALADHRLSATIDNDDPNNLNNPTHPAHPLYGSKEFLLAMDFKEFDYDNSTEKASALTPQTKKIFKTLFGTQDPTNITRDEVNTALWKDHESRTPSDKAKAVIRELLGSSANPDDYELRLLRPDEYQRASASLGYGQKNLWTHMDGYYVHDGGRRDGLLGGGRHDGGSANVGRGHRAYRSGGDAVRLVLSRKK